MWIQAEKKGMWLLELRNEHTNKLRGLLKTLPVMLNLFQYPLFIRGLRIMSAMTIVLKV